VFYRRAVRLPQIDECEAADHDVEDDENAESLARYGFVASFAFLHLIYLGNASMFEL
jgi:hypothetical protein